MIVFDQGNYLDSKNISSTRAFLIVIYVLCGSIPNLGLKTVLAHKMQICLFDII